PCRPLPDRSPPNSAIARTSRSRVSPFVFMQNRSFGVPDRNLRAVDRVLRSGGSSSPKRWIETRERWIETPKRWNDFTERDRPAFGRELRHCLPALPVRRCAAGVFARILTALGEVVFGLFFAVFAALERRQAQLEPDAHPEYVAE